MAITSAPIPTLPASDLERATAFYTDVMGFSPSEEQPAPEGVMFDSGEGQLLVYATPHAGTARNTQAAWMVDDLQAEVARLQAAGVEFQTFDIPDEQGEWDGVIARGQGQASAWFTDSEGNTLALEQVG
ncbi:VOC family protein [Salsipaludibacter albus]|uniref:VOC family protein n=1 Tax=Salsipaludibacter albus TaxID=2849650 RepID=UPI001EE4D981|nr:VOC family protein [Salsipaludibacter albus]MBY5164128.1 VOC family protein [Salsipaludibacter albus]